MILFRWVILAAALPLIAAAQTPLTERGIVDGALGVLQDFVKTLLDGIQATLTGAGSLFTISTYITPASSGGRRIKVTGGRWIGYNSFLGIPFGEAPSGTKRFDRPSPKVYTGDIKALKFGPACIQPKGLAAGLSGQSEDCLTLNILTPEGVAGTSTRLPVMVWLYGGSFISGTGSYYTAFEVAALSYAKKIKKPIIHVTINYRLGVWGFGLGREMKAAGAANVGLLDQRLALEWVKENIAAFGGDPGRITVYGQSAGAGSVALHLLDKKNEGLVAGAIMMSGAQDGEPIPRTDDYQAPYDELVQLAGCANATSSLDCLRGLSADALNEAQTKLGNDKKYVLGLGSQIWRPTVDGDVVPDSPYAMLAAGRLADIPFITGTNKDDGTLFVDAEVKTQDDIPPQMDKLYPSPLNASLWPIIFDKYPNAAALGAPFDTGNDTFGLSVAYKQFAAIMTDSSYLAPKRNHIRSANKAGIKRTWNYVFEGPTPIVPKFLGIMHATDLLYTFGIVSQYIPLVGWKAQDHTMSLQMMEYWLNFAYNQDPNSVNLPNWPQHDYPANKNCLQLLPGNVTVIQDDFREDRVAMWNDPEVAYQMYM